MSHDPVSANGEAMPAADIPFITPQAGAVALACVALHRHRVAIDNLRYRAEAELVEYARAREDMELLIARLIDKLDEADGDPDLSPSFGFVVAGYIDEQEEEDEYGEDLEGDVLDLGEMDFSDDEDGGDLEHDEAERGLADADAVALWFQDAREMGVVR